MLVSVLLFAVGLVLLIKGGDWFVDGATGIAKRFNLPDISRRICTGFFHTFLCIFWR